jgi:hypothetical protein
LKPSHGRQKGKPKRPKEAQPAGTKERKELVPPLLGSYLAHSLSNVHSHSSNSNKSLEQAFPATQ